MKDLILEGIKEGNLKNISLSIPRNKVIVLTGLSGSGKTTLAMDVIYQECQRQYLEAMGYQGLHKPDIERLWNSSPAICITQKESNRNPRSTVGTVTDIYTDLRMIFEKLSARNCPSCGASISASECREETEKKNNEFLVYMYCKECGFKMDKLTRSYFSYNTKEGACPSCQGLGKKLEIRKERVVNEELTLEAGAVVCWEGKYSEYQQEILEKAFCRIGLSKAGGIPINQFTPLQKAVLYDGMQCKEVLKAVPKDRLPKTVTKGRFEGIIPGLNRRLSETKGNNERLMQFYDMQICTECCGERLNLLSRSAIVEGKRLPELSALSLEKLYEWINGQINCRKGKEKLPEMVYLCDLETKLRRILRLGLGYLTLDREVMTLSGGEGQRLRLSAVLDSTVTGIIYILDEPTVGLHPQDTGSMIEIVKELRDLGNTVIVIEHDIDVMKAADYVIDLGPRAGRYGGEIIGAGTLEQLIQTDTSITGAYLRRQQERTKGDLSYFKTRREKELFCHTVEVKEANLHNLQEVDIKIPAVGLTVVTGVSGSGKSTLIFEILAQGKGCKALEGMDYFDKIITVEQGSINRMRRSNIATYTELYSDIRKLFAETKQAKELALTIKDFSFNSKGGRCENCEGLGYITSNMLFFEDVEVPCPVCKGKRFQEEVVSVVFCGYSIVDFLKLTVEEAYKVLEEYPKLEKRMKVLLDAGLSYLELGQLLTTLSGGEAQRLKLSVELMNAAGNRMLYLIDEPSAGLHPWDTEQFLKLLKKITGAGHAAIVVEHNLQIIKAADWIIDLGPGGGTKGGRVVFEGTPEQLIQCKTSATGRALRVDLGYE